MPRTTPRHRLVVWRSPRLLLLVGIAAFARAQSAPDAGAASRSKSGSDDVVQLTPFEVVTGTDHGYAAQSTLAGTRLNTRLSDISSPIQVVTEQFMQDVGATDLESLLVYTTDTEVGGLSGNYYEANATLGNANGAFAGPEAKGNFAGRVRGLQGPDRTRNFFQTDIPLDTYNLQSVDIQRGPNSILFGLGSPAGLINSTFKAPNLGRNSLALEFKTDRWGSTRETFDANVILAPRTLALRVMGMAKDTQYEQKPAYARDSRLTSELRFTPRLAAGITTDFNVNFEFGHGTANSPDTAPPWDNISPWYTYLNKWYNPTGGWPSNYNSVPDQAPYLAGSQGAVGGWSNEPGLIFPDPNSSVTGYGPGLVDATRRNGSGGTQYIAVANPTAGANYPNHFLSQIGYYANNPQMLAIIHNYEQLTGLPFTQASGFGWHPAQILDRSIFDYKTDMLAGPSNTDFQWFKNLNVSLRQTFLNGDLGYEVSYDRQNYDNESVYLMARADTIDVEINKYIRNNVTPNPNFGRPVVAARTSGQMRWRDREAYRGQAYYNLDFQRLLPGRRSLLGSILGAHTFTVSMSDQKYHTLQYGFWPIKWGDGYTANFDAQDVYFGVHYLNADVDTATASSLANAHIHGIGVAQIPQANDLTVSSVKSGALVTKPGNDLWIYNQPEGIDRLIHNTSDKEIKTDTKSKVFVWQSRLFSENVIGLFGLRKDEFRSWQKPSLSTVADATYIPGNGIHNKVGDPYSPSWAYASPLVVSGTTRSYGLMVHSPEFINRHLPWGMKLSVGYNEASNFNPSNATTDPYGLTNPPTSGNTKDYTVQVQMFGDKLTIRATRFKTNQINVVDSGSITGVAQNMKLRIVRALNGLSLEAQTGSTSKNTNPEWVVNKWFFGDNYDKTLAMTPLPAGWTVENHPELLTQPLRVRAAYYTTDPHTTSANQPDISPEEIAYRTAWFKAQPESEWYRPIGADLYNAFGLKPDFNKTGGFFYESANSTVAATTNQQSQGTELEVTYNPLPNWRIIANASHTTATNTGAWSNLDKYIQAFQPIAYDGYNSSIPRGTKIRYWDRQGFATIDGTGDGNAQMLGWYWYNDVHLKYLLTRAQDGMDIDQLRPYRWSITSSYDFRTGRLKGFGIGGNVRWEDKIVLGYYPKYVTTLPTGEVLNNWISDVTKPITGDANTTFDAWVSYTRRLKKSVTWRIQLNLRNLNAKDDLIPVAANGDGSIGTYRIKASPSWELTNRFEF